MQIQGSQLTVSHKSYIIHLPDEMFKAIFEYIPNIQSLGACCLVSRKWQILANASGAWRLFATFLGITQEPFKLNCHFAKILKLMHETFECDLPKRVFDAIEHLPMREIDHEYSLFCQSLLNQYDQFKSSDGQNHFFKAIAAGHLYLIFINKIRPHSTIICFNSRFDYERKLSKDVFLCGGYEYEAGQFYSYFINDDDEVAYPNLSIQNASYFLECVILDQIE